MVRFTLYVKVRRFLMEIEYIIRHDITHRLYFITIQGDETDLQELSKHLEGLDVVKRNVRPQMIRNVGDD